MYYYVYRITNVLNGKIYIGAHGAKNLNDGYMGSGKAISAALKKYGIENFKKEILKFFDSKDAMLDYEKELVTSEFIRNPLVYNMQVGGKSIWLGNVFVKDNEGNILQISKNDERYLNGEFKHVSFNEVTVKDKDNNTFRVRKDDPRYLSGELVFISTNMSTVKDKDGIIFRIPTNEKEFYLDEVHGVNQNRICVHDINEKELLVYEDDPRYLSGELVRKSHMKGLVTVKDEKGNTFKVKKDDPRYLSGELVHFTKGMINVYDKNGKKLKVKKDDPRYLSGELIFTSIGFVTVKDENGNTFRVKKDDPRYLSGELIFISTGNKGIQKWSEESRKAASERGKNREKYVGIQNKETQTKTMIPERLLEEYIKNGWILGWKGVHRVKSK